MTNTNLMTNTLTRSIKPIQLPKLNTNLLSMISFIVLYAIIFVTANSLTVACDELKEQVAYAYLIKEAAYLAALAAVGALALAEQTGNQALIDAAREAAIAAAEFYETMSNSFIQLLQDLVDCLKAKQADSGGCDSGSCA